MMPFWCACCTAWQTCTEQLEALAQVESLLASQYSVIGSPSTSSITK